MEDKAHILEKLAQLVKNSPVNTEVMLSGHKQATTRFANNHINQNVLDENREIACRVIKDGQVGYARSNQVQGQAAENMVKQALQRMDAQPATEKSIDLVSPRELKGLDNFDTPTAYLAADQRAEIVKSIVSRVQENGLMAAGTVVNGFEELALVNSKGVQAFHRYSHFQVTLTVYDQENASGWTAIESTTYNPDLISPAVDRTIQKTILSKSPQTIKPGRYTVILEPAATATFVENLGWLAFSAKEYLLQTSCIYNKIGKTITGPLVNIQDDAYHPLTLGMPFDYEGSPKKALTLIENGIAKAIVHDSLTASQMKTSSTGHSLPQPNKSGPQALNLVMAAGHKTVQDMISETQAGVLVSRFHYNRTVDTKKTILTGLTRDGTYFIRDGQIVFPIQNLRYNESILDSFSRIETIGNEQLLMGEYGKVVVPALKVNDFLFTDVTSSK